MAGERQDGDDRGDPAAAVKALLDEARIADAVAFLKNFLLQGRGTEKEKWIVTRLVFNACSTEEWDGDFMGEAVRWTEEIGDRAEPWVLLGKAYLFQAEDLALGSDPSGSGFMAEPVGFARSFSNNFLYQAEESFREALRRDPANSEAGNLLAWVLCWLKDYAGAREQALAVLESNPDNSYSGYLLGEIELYFKRPLEAEARFRKAFEVDPTCLNALSGVVRSLLALEKHKDAEAALIALAEVDPERGELVELAYKIHEGRDDFASAARLYRKLLEYSPDRTDLILQLSVAQIRLLAMDAARGNLERILKSDPRHSGALFHLGHVEETQGLYDAAIECYMKIAKDESAWLEHALKRLKLLAYMKSIDGKYDDAIAIYDVLRKVFPFDSVVLGNWALSLSQKGLAAQADEAFASILEITPDDGATLNNFGLHLMASGRLERGLEMLETAAIRHGDLDAAENLGVYYLYSKSDPDRAANYFLLVLKADPKRDKSLILLESIRRHRSARSD